MDAQSTELQRVKTAVHQLPDIKVSEEFAGWKVLGMVADNSACGYFRIINPLHMLRMLGAKVHYTSINDGENLRDYDIILAPRQHNGEVLEVLKQEAWEGKLIVYEIDDDLHHVPPTNPAYGVYHQGAAPLRMIPEFLNMAHGWTTTTPELAKLYYQHNRNPVIIDNFIDYSFRDWGVSVDWEEGKPIFTPQPLKRPAEWGDRVVIGYAGGNTHQADLELIGPEIRSVLKRNPQAMLAFYSSHQLGQWFAKKFQIPDDQIYFVPARHFMDYPVGLQGFDIALAPIECNQFNLCKSSLRCYEYAAVGAAIVASNVGPYAWFQARHPESALLVGNSPKTFSTWSEAIQLLIDNPELRRTMQSANRQLMIDHYSLERNVWRWPMAWAAIAEQRNAGNLGPDPERREKNWYMSYGKAGVHDLCPCHSGQKYSECHKGAWG